MAQRRPAVWLTLLSAVLIGAACVGVGLWWISLQNVEQQLQETRRTLKKFVSSERKAPDQELLAYLNTAARVEGRYQKWLARVTVPAVAEAASADPQLYFQEQFHDVQRNLERLAAARAVPVPEQLGFPKELPPSDTVPRLLAQLTLMREAAALIFEQGVVSLTSLKIEDPEPVPEAVEGGAFLTRVPIRVRLAGSLPQLMKILLACARAEPIIDVRTVRILSSAEPPSAEPAADASDAAERLDVELVLARYLAAAPLAVVPPEPAAVTSSSPVERKARSGTAATRPRTAPRASREDH